MATEATVQAEDKARSPAHFALTKWLAPLVSAGLLYLSFFPVACGWLAWVALMPLLCLVRLPGRPRWLSLAAYLGGLTFFLPVLQWFRVADPRMYFTWIALAVYIAVYWPIAIWLIRLIERRTQLPLIITFPIVWVSLDYLRWGIFGSFASLITGSHQHDLPGGFSWYYLGHSQHDFLEMIQIADITGVYGITFVMAAVNALLFEILFAKQWVRRLVNSEPEAVISKPRTLLLQGIAVGTTLLLCLGYGVWRLGEETRTPGPRVAFLQGFIDQKTRNETVDPDPEKRAKARRTLQKHYEDLAVSAATLKPDLMVWPETSCPGAWSELEPGLPTTESRAFASDVMLSLRTPVLLGMTAMERIPGGRPKLFNSAILLGRDSRNGHWLGRYDKIHRVPFGEYIPFGGAMAWLDKLGLYDEGIYVQPGTEFTRFALPGQARIYHFGVLICYEDTDPSIAWPYVEPGRPPVDFLLNISNDAWFDGTAEHDQHLAICRFRAIECRRSIGRAVNMGISALIDSNGRVLAPDDHLVGDHHLWEVPDRAASLPVSRWLKFKKQPGILIGRMPIDTRESLYARIGDTFAIGCGGVLLLILIGLALRRRGTVG